MRFDASEMKTVSECARKWQLSSRNSFHLAPTVTNSNLTFGTLFHEALAALYLGGDIDSVVEQAVNECEDTVQEKVIRNMLEGYYDEVLFEDLERYRVLDIEHSVYYELPELANLDVGGVAQTEDLNHKEDGRVWVCGSIDMICLDMATNEIWGFEHKTCKKFRSNVYFIVDEQPRVYTYELLKYVEEYNKARRHLCNFTPVTLGGIFINEVKKVQRKFEYCRRACSYNEAQLNRFYQKMLAVGSRIKRLQAFPNEAQCSPGYMSCGMCDYALICEKYAYDDITFEQIITEFEDEFHVRAHDHLEEKSERKIDI